MDRIFPEDRIIKTTLAVNWDRTENKDTGWRFVTIIEPFHLDIDEKYKITLQKNGKIFIYFSEKVDEYKSSIPGKIHYSFFCPSPLPEMMNPDPENNMMHEGDKLDSIIEIVKKH